MSSTELRAVDTGRRSGVHAIAGKCAACVSVIAALGLAGGPHTGIALSHVLTALSYDSGDWGGAGEPIVLPSYNTVNLPLGGGPQNNFLGGGNGGNGGDGVGSAATGGAGVGGGPTTDPAGGTVFPLGQTPATWATDSSYLPGSGESIVFPSYNTVNFPLGGVGENNFLGGGGGGNGGNGIGSATAGAPDTTAALNPLPVGQAPAALWNTAVYTPGSGESIVLPSYNTTNLPLGGVGENNFLGGGDGGNGGVGVGSATAGGGDAPEAGFATMNPAAELSSSANESSLSLTNTTVVLPGAYDTVVLPGGNTVNFPFGGVGENNFFGGGAAGVAGTGLAPAEPAGPQVITLPMNQFTIPLLNTTVVLPGSNDTIVLPFSNVVNFPFFGNGDINLFGSHFSTDFTGAGFPALDVGSVLGIPAGDTSGTMSDTAVFLPGSASRIVFPSYNTINFPLGGVGENNFLGAGDGGNGPGGGDGGDGPLGAVGGSGYGGDNTDTGVVTGGSGESSATGIGIGGLGGDGGQGFRIFPVHVINADGSEGTASGPLALLGIGGGGHDATGIGIGGDGGDGGGGAQLFPIYLVTGNGSGGTVADDPAALLTGFAPSFVNGADGATGIGIGGIGGDGAGGADLFPIYLNWADSGGLIFADPAAGLTDLWGNLVGLPDFFGGFEDGLIALVTDIGGVF